MSGHGIVRSKMQEKHIMSIDFYSYMLRGFQMDPDKPALVDPSIENSQVTYRQLQYRTDLIAQHLMKYGFTRGSTLVLYSENCCEYALMAVAALRLGGKFAAVNHLLTAKDLERMLDMCDGKFLFTSQEVGSKAVEATCGKCSQVKVIFVNGEYQGCVPFSNLEKHVPDLPRLAPISSFNIIPEKDVCWILFSSGTTGLPKATMLSHTNLVASVSALCHPATNVLREKNLVFVPMSHIFGIGLTMFGFCVGTCTVLMKAFDPQVYLQCIETFKLPIIHVVPPIAVLLAKHPMTEQYDLTSVEVIVCGAAPLSKEIEKEMCLKLKGPNARVMQLYGLTETTGGVTGSYIDESYRPRDLPHPPPGTCGLLLSNYEAKIVDIKTGESLGHNQDGELIVRGPQIMLGYQKNELATNETIDKDGWLHTGDIGHYDKNGYFFIVDRLKELIKYKGFQVPPAELEALLLTHPAVADCAVIGIPDESAGELPHAWVVPKLGMKITPQNVVKFVEDNAAPFKRLRGGVKLVEAIPKTASGKILRREMKEQMTKAKL